MATDPSGNSVIPSDSSSPIATTGSQTFDLLREGWIDAHIVCTLRGLNWTSASCFQMMIDLARRLNCVLESSPYYAHNMFRVRGILNDITQLQHDSVSPSERENPILHIVFDRCADIFRAALEEGSIGYDATVEQFLRERASQSGIRLKHLKIKLEKLPSNWSLRGKPFEVEKLTEWFRKVSRILPLRSSHTEMSVRFEGDGAIEIPARHFPSDYINKDIHANRVEKDLVDWKTLVTDSVAMFGMGMDVDDWNATPLVPRAVAPHAVDAVTPIAERDAPAGGTEQSLNVATSSAIPPAVTAGKPTAERVPTSVPAVGKEAKSKVKGKRINERMAAMLREDPLKLDWSASRWALALDCKDGTVKGTPTWKGHIRNARLLEKADRTSRARGR